MTAAPDSGLDARIADWRPDLEAALRGLYGERASDTFDALVARARDAHRTRTPELLALDRLRDGSDADWYQRPERVGYMAYADRFGGDLAGVRARIPYLRELGVDVIHLLSVLAPREKEDDGGFAIRDYRTPDARLGTSSELDALVADLRRAGISLCLDFVLNHTSDDHEWAVAARNGSSYHTSLYRTFETRAEPDAYEATLPEVFPHLAPGNFTFDEALGRWVWTTFREYQWDLDWSNPDVMLEMADVAMALANRGVEILRLDAIAFTWKRLGTNCQNQPEAHLIAQALRAVIGIAAPATILLAEAIVGPEDLIAYLGHHELERRECELAYHNQLMVQGWSMVATQRADLARVALARLSTPPDRATWFTYVRCHDDIGWAIDDQDAAAVGATGFGHRSFLAEFYRGEFPSSFARGTPFAVNPVTGDERTSGMAATLAGVAAALESGDEAGIDDAIQRLLLVYAIAFGYGGIPIVYMGDELCQLDDAGYRDDPAQRDDSRWTHRPRFDEALAAQRYDTGTLPGRVWAGMQRLVTARRRCLPLHGAAPTFPLDVGHPQVFGWLRRHPRHGDLIGLANVGTEPAIVTLPSKLTPLPLGPLSDRLDPGAADPLRLDGLTVRWLTTALDFPTIPSPSA